MRWSRATRPFSPPTNPAILWGSARRWISSRRWRTASTCSTACCRPETPAREPSSRPGASSSSRTRPTRRTTGRWTRTATATPANDSAAPTSGISSRPGRSSACDSPACTRSRSWCGRCARRARRSPSAATARSSGRSRNVTRAAKASCPPSGRVHETRFARLVVHGFERVRPGRSARRGGPVADDGAVRAAGADPRHRRHHVLPPVPPAAAAPGGAQQAAVGARQGRPRADPGRHLRHGGRRRRRQGRPARRREREARVPEVDDRRKSELGDVPVLPLRIYGDPVLRAKAKPALAVTKEFVLDLFDTMKAEDGVGLAAPQVGVSEQVLVLAVPVKKRSRVDLTLVNPTITRAEGWELGEEGCLSVPGVYDEVRRAFSISLTALDE